MTDTPNLDKMLQVREDGSAQQIQDFLDWYCDEFAHCSKPHGGMLSEESDEYHREKVMAAYFGLDLREMERERTGLLNDLRERNRQTQIIRRRKAKASK